MDTRYGLVVAVAGVVAFLGGVPVAARPAAVVTQRVQTAASISYLFFMISRLANLFYLPVLASLVVQVRPTDQLPMFQTIILACSLGTLAAWLLLPNLVSLYCHLVELCAVRALPAALLPQHWPGLLRNFCRRYPLRVRPFRLEGIPKAFLAYNVLATALWTVGALCALYASALVAPEYATTAVMLSGLVNAVAAISLSLLVDPQASLLTDRGEQRPVFTAAWHLSLGNVLGSLLGLAVFLPGTRLIGAAAKLLGSHGAQWNDSLWPLVLLNLFITLLATTAYASRIAAVETGARATALLVFNLFSMVMRLAGQVLAPSLAAVADNSSRPGDFVGVVRWVLLGASLGAFSGLLLMPSFAQIYRQAVRQLQRRGSLPLVLMHCLRPAAWRCLASCRRRPNLLGLLGKAPSPFLWANLVVIAFHTVGVPASIYAGKLVRPELARTATLLSSLVNGLATITLGLIVDPAASRLTDEVCAGRRP
ncbi:hypothetical protein ABS71_20825, partial [bacterium SCN 62-11]